MFTEVPQFNPSQQQFDALVRLYTVIAAAVTFIVIALRTRNRRAFADVSAGALAGAGLVTGGAIVFCAFFKAFIPVLADMQLYLGISGLSLIYLSITAISDAWKAGEEPAPRKETPAPPPGPPQNR